MKKMLVILVAATAVIPSGAGARLQNFRFMN